MLNCCHDLYFTTCMYTLENYYLALERCFNESPMKFCAESHYLLRFCFGLIWGVAGFLAIVHANFGVHNRDMTSLRTS